MTLLLELGMGTVDDGRLARKKCHGVLAFRADPSVLLIAEFAFGEGDVATAAEDGGRDDNRVAQLHR